MFSIYSVLKTIDEKHMFVVVLMLDVMIEIHREKRSSTNEMGMNVIIAQQCL